MMEIQKTIDDYNVIHSKLFNEFEDLIKRYKLKYGSNSKYDVGDLYAFTYYMPKNTRLANMPVAGFSKCYRVYLKQKMSVVYKNE